MSDPGRTIWCGNLSSDVTDDLLYELFLQAGPLDKVHIPKTNGRNSSYGFITFKHEVSVPYVLDLMKGIHLYGRQLNLKTRTGGNSDTPTHDTRQSCHSSVSSQDYTLAQTPPVSMPTHITQSPFANMMPDFNMLQNMNPFAGLAGLYSGAPLIPSVLPKPPQSNHQSSGSHRGGDLYYDRNNWNDRRNNYSSNGGRDYHGNSGGRDSRDNNGRRDRGRDWDRDRDRERERDRDRTRSRDYDHRNRYDDKARQRSHDHYRSRD